MSDAFTTIRYERDGEIGNLILARPNKRNAQNPKMWEELAQLGAELTGDESLRCLVISGDGPTFSAGIDLVEGMAGLVAGLAERTEDEEARAAGRLVAGTFNWILSLAAQASPPCAATPTAPACNWPWRAISASSPRGPRSV
jgi:enoyl-CoA hydratase